MDQVTQEELEKMSPEEIAELQKKNCIFCKIVAGEIQSKKVYEDDNFFAILDINPVTEGHVLVIPKLHIQVMPQMPPELVGKLSLACKVISQKMLKALGVQGTSIFIANGQLAGQKAPHFIVHIIPRKANDDVPLNPKFEEIPEAEYLETQKALKAALLGVQPVAKEEPKDDEPEEEVDEPEDKENANLDALSEYLSK